MSTRPSSGGVAITSRGKGVYCFKNESEFYGPGAYRDEFKPTQKGG
jgi:hypothetical protein